MKFYINEMNDHTVTLMTEAGHVLAYFTTILDALTACDEWYRKYPEAPAHQVKIHRNSLDDDYSDLEVA